MTEWWIHGGAGPVGNAETQEEERHQGVEHGAHDMSHSPGEKQIDMRARYFQAETQAHPWLARPHLLASLMRAMAISILLRRKMSNKMITTSRMLKMITVEQGGQTSGWILS